ncbi:SIMPL domain-containing protein [Altererythrobacter sp. MF3-039]|uniref:SIMPL domain-containing protein n=1 Tax=Altererythrobacter sp. MF3-039 TaxID=3252901 RepID=UPI00390CD3E5
MIRPIFALLAATAVSLPLHAPASAAEIQIQVSNPVVELSVNEIVRSAPDVAQIGAGVVTRAPTAQGAMRMNAEAMDRLIRKLRDLGIDRKDIQTSNFNLNPDYRYNRETNEQTFSGYSVNNQVSVKLRDLERAGEVLDALVAAGANNVYGPNFMLENDLDAKALARKNAFARGLVQAREFAQMAGYSDVRLLEVSENFQSYGRVPPPAMAIRVATESAVADTPIEPGEVGTGVTLGLKYEMVN